MEWQTNVMLYDGNLYYLESGGVARNEYQLRSCVMLYPLHPSLTEYTYTHVDCLHYPFVRGRGLARYPISFTFCVKCHKNRDTHTHTHMVMYRIIGTFLFYTWCLSLSHHTLPPPPLFLPPPGQHTHQQLTTHWGRSVSTYERLIQFPHLSLKSVHYLPAKLPASWA